MLRILSDEIEQRLFDTIDPLYLILYVKMMTGKSPNLKKILRRVENVFSFLDLNSQIVIAFDLIEKKIEDDSLWTEISEIFENKINSVDQQYKVNSIK